jgi:hypothetical protein
MKLILRMLPLLALVASPGLADTGYKQLFSGSNGIAEEDQVAIYRQLELKLTRDGEFISSGCDPAPFRTEVADLNGDGIPEVFVTGGNDCTSGVTGSSIWLFVKSTSGSVPGRGGNRVAAAT